MTVRPILGKELLGYVALGFVLPWLVFLGACFRFGRFGDIADFPARLFGGGYNYFLIACLDAIPFVIVVALAVIHQRIREGSRSRLFGLLVAAVVSIVLSAMYQIAIWSNLMGPHPDSLMGIAFVTCSALATVASITVGLIAWAISAVIVRVQVQKHIH